MIAGAYPPGSVVRFHEPSLWELYRGYVVAAIIVFLVQSGLIGALLVQRTHRRRAQRTLTERLRFETVLSDLSAKLSACPAEEVDQQIETGLREPRGRQGGDHEYHARAARTLIEQPSRRAVITDRPPLDQNV